MNMRFPVRHVAKSTLGGPPRPLWESLPDHSGRVSQSTVYRVQCTEYSVQSTVQGTVQSTVQNTVQNKVQGY